MVLDIHTHVGSVKYHEYCLKHGRLESLDREDGMPTYGDPMELVAILDRFGFDGAVVFANPYTEYFDQRTQKEHHELVASGGMPAPYHEENRTVLEQSSRYDELHPALTICNHPGHDNVDDVRSLLDTRDDVVALKLHTSGSHTYVDDLAGTEFLELASKHELPIIVHLKRNSDNPDFNLPTYGRPVDLQRLAREHPDIVFVGAHAGGFSESFLDLSQELPNLFFDMSPPIVLHATPSYRTADAIDLPPTPREMVLEVARRYPNGAMWGSDFPWSRIDGISPLEEFRDYDRLPRDVKEILQGNNHRVFDSI